MSRTFRLGLFIVGALLILGIGVFLIGNKQFLFTSTYPLKATFNTVAGLNSGAEVHVGGIHKGTVRQIQLPAQPNDKVTVLMDLDRSTRNIVKKDSVASIETEGLLGNKYVAIAFGSTDSPKISAGDTIGSAPPIDIQDLIKKTNQILDATQETMRNVADTTDNMKSMTTKIEQGKGTVGALINDKTMYNQLNAAVGQAQAGASAFREDMEALKHNWFLRGFFHSRGYEDAAELTKYEIAKMPAGEPIRTFDYDAKQIFEKLDSAKLKNGKKLNEAGKFLEKNQFGLAAIVAYSGMKGDTNTNLTLSQARAFVVRDYLADNFRMDDTHLKTMAVAKNVQPSKNDVGNVRIMVYRVGTPVPPAKYQASESGNAAKNPG